MFTIVIIIIFILFTIKKNNDHMEREKTEKKYIVLDEQYTYTERPMIQTHQYMDLYDIHWRA